MNPVTIQELFRSGTAFSAKLAPDRTAYFAPPVEENRFHPAVLVVALPGNKVHVDLYPLFIREFDSIRNTIGVFRDAPPPPLLSLLKHAARVWSWVIDLPPALAPAYADLRTNDGAEFARRANIAKPTEKQKESITRANIAWKKYIAQHHQVEIPTAVLAEEWCNLTKVPFTPAVIDAFGRSLRGGRL